MTDVTAYSHQVVIAADHPATNGHFPGQPVMPGVMTLAYLQQAFRRIRPNQYITRLGKVKFVATLLPGNTLTITISAKSDNTFHFHCTDSSGNRTSVGDFMTADAT